MTRSDGEAATIVVSSTASTCGVLVTQNDGTNGRVCSQVAVQVNGYGAHAGEHLWTVQPLMSSMEAIK